MQKERAKENEVIVTEFNSSGEKNIFYGQFNIWKSNSRRIEKEI